LVTAFLAPRRSLKISSCRRLPEERKGKDNSSGSAVGQHQRTALEGISSAKILILPYFFSLAPFEPDRALVRHDPRAPTMLPNVVCTPQIPLNSREALFMQ
jgi:hypothetical protein